MIGVSYKKSQKLASQSRFSPVLKTAKQKEEEKKDNYRMWELVHNESIQKALHKKMK